MNRKIPVVAKKMLLFAITALALYPLCSTADAHSFVAFPDFYTVRANEKASVNFTLSEPFATPDISLYGMDHELDAKLVYEDGTSVRIPGLSFYNTKNPSDTDPANSDSQRASVSIADDGPAYIAAALRMNIPQDPPLPFVGFAKTAINVASGAGKKAIGGDDVLEIVPLNDLAFITEDEPFKVKVLFKGSPVGGVTVSAAYDGLPPKPDGEQDWSVFANTDGDGLASITPDRPNLWLISAGHYGEDGVAYGATLLILVNSTETERDVTDLFMPQSDNEAGAFFGDFIEGAVPEADAFFASHKLRWASYAATGNGNTKLYTDGKNQLEGNSGVSFTVPTTAAPGISAITGFGNVYAFTPGNIGETAFKTLKDKMNELGTGPSGMVIAHPGDILPGLGLRIVQVYGDGTDRDVTAQVVDAGFDISKMSEGEIAIWWGALTADRDISDSNFLPIKLSSVGEDGKILYDGKRDDKISATFYIGKIASDAGSGSGGCDAGAFGLAALALAAMAKRKIVRRSAVMKLLRDIQATRS